MATIIGQGITVEGEITCEEDLSIAGNVRGKVVTDATVTLEHGSTVDADVKGANIAVGGALTGNVSASDRVDVLSGGRLIGDVKTSRFTIADGASFKGNVDMDV